jgi:ribosomal protein S18 acetylase RimI-like enzyme
MTKTREPSAFELPAALSRDGFALRPETEGDIPFLVELYASTREAELAPVPWTLEQKRAFLLQQFDAQRRDYRARLLGCVFGIIERGGEPIGRLYLDARGRALHVVDIALAPQWRGRGVGGAILEAVIASARADGLAVGIFVEKYNPALSLYRRLGFVETADHGVYLEMERAPEPAS